jgi:hypothetical protein
MLAERPTRRARGAPPSRARLSDCPHCGRNAQLSFGDLLPQRKSERIVKCRSCGRECAIAARTRLVAGFAGFIVILAFVAIADPHGDRLMVIISGMLIAMLTTVRVTRLTLRLVPTSRQRSEELD